MPAAPSSVASGTTPSGAGSRSGGSREPAFVNLHIIAGTAQAAGQMYNASRDGLAIIVTAGLLDNEVFSDNIVLGPRPGFDEPSRSWCRA